MESSSEVPGKSGDYSMNSAIIQPILHMSIFSVYWDPMSISGLLYQRVHTRLVYFFSLFFLASPKSQILRDPSFEYKRFEVFKSL